jgi:hypothetical protein
LCGVSISISTGYSDELSEGEPHEVRFAVAEAGQLRLGDHRDRERAVTGIAVHAVRAGQQRGIPLQERLKQALVARIFAVEQCLPPLHEELVIRVRVRPTG